MIPRRRIVIVEFKESSGGVTSRQPGFMKGYPRTVGNIVLDPLFQQVFTPGFFQDAALVNTSPDKIFPLPVFGRVKIKL